MGGVVDEDERVRSGVVRCLSAVPENRHNAMVVAAVTQMLYDTHEEVRLAVLDTLETWAINHAAASRILEWLGKTSDWPNEEAARAAYAVARGTYRFGSVPVSLCELFEQRGEWVRSQVCGVVAMCGTDEMWKDGCAQHMVEWAWSVISDINSEQSFGPCAILLARWCGSARRDVRYEEQCQKLALALCAWRGFADQRYGREVLESLPRILMDSEASIMTRLREAYVKVIDSELGARRLTSETVKLLEETKVKIGAVR